MNLQSTNPAATSAPPPAERHHGAKLTVEFNRISPGDKSGMIHVDCEGPQGFHYACLGTHHGAQVCEGVDEEKVMAFGAAVAKLVREHFGEVVPLLDHESPPWRGLGRARR